VKPNAGPHKLLATAAGTIALFLLLPGLVAIPVALNDSRFIALPHGALSLRHFETLLSDGAWLSSMSQSAAIALAATLLALTIGTACAIGMWRMTGRCAAWMGALVLAPLILPPIVSALALYRAWVLLSLYDTWLGVVVAHTILALPFVVISVSTALSMLDPRLEQASRSLGATPLMTTLRVLVPNIKLGIVSAAVFAFITSWDEIVVTLFVASRAVYTLPRRMWDGIRENVDPTVAAVATLLIALTLLVVWTSSLMQRRSGHQVRDSVT
jgi:putative spermidine/putrescine transport system permease protein